MVQTIRLLSTSHLQYYRMRRFFLYLLVSLLLVCCKKSDEVIFTINLHQTSPTTLTEFSDNILVKISYEHSDGYIGFYDPDYLSLEIKDSRLENADYYHLIPVSPPENTLSTNGEVLIEIDSPFILGSGSIETLEFRIRIQDREMRWSNQVTTPTVTVYRE